MDIKKMLFVISSFTVIALTTTSCGSGYKHTISKYNAVYSADLNHDGEIKDIDGIKETNLTWAQSYDTLIKEANSMEDLNAIADNLHIAKDEIKRTSLARYEILHEAEELVMSTGTIMPIYNYGDPYLLKPGIEGIYTNELGFKFLDQLHYTNGNANNFKVSVGTKGESFDPAYNTDVSTTIAMNQYMMGAMRYAQGEEVEPGIYKTELVDGLCTYEKNLVTSDVEKIGESGYISFDDCNDLKDEYKDEYEGTARYTITVKEDAKWSDGTKITADDFIYAWARSSTGVYNGQPFGMWTNMFDMIRGYNAWTNIGQQANNNPDTWSEDAKEAWNDLDEKEQKQWLQSYDKNGCAGGMAGVMRDENNPYTFTVQLINDCDYFDSLLAFPAFMPVPKKNIIIVPSGKDEKDVICEEHGDWWMNKNGEYLTSGPMKLDGPIDNVDSGGLKLTRNEHFSVGPAALANNIEFKFIDKDSTIYDTYKSNTIQFTNQFPSSVIDDLMKKPDWHSAEQIGLFFYDFNVNDNTMDIRKNMSERDREKLRMAMVLLMNRYDIAVNVAKKGCTPANGFVSDGVMETCIPKWVENGEDPVTGETTGNYVAETATIGTETVYVTKNWHDRNLDMSQYWNNESDPYTDHYMDKRIPGGFYKTSNEGDPAGVKENCDKAIELAKQAGIKYDERTGKFTNFPRITLITNNGTALEDLAERLQAYYDLWGIDVTIQTQEWQSFLATRRIGDYALARQGWVADYNDPRTYLDLCTSDSGNNDTQLGKDSWHSSH